VAAATQQLRHLMIHGLHPLPLVMNHRFN
jgi:hypothetical protein